MAWVPFKKAARYLAATSLWPAASMASSFCMSRSNSSRNRP